MLVLPAQTCEQLRDEIVKRLREHAESYYKHGMMLIGKRGMKRDAEFNLTRATALRLEADDIERAMLNKGE